MEWFKNLIGGFKWAPTNKGIQNKKGTELIQFNLAEGSTFNGNINISENGKRIIEKRNENLDIISKSNVPDSAQNNIQDFEHVEQIKRFVEKGANSSAEIASFVRDLMPNMISTPDFIERKNIELALDFLKESSTSEKSILVWSYLLSIVNVGNNPAWFKNNPLIINKIRACFPLEKRDALHHGMTIIFGRFGGKPDFNINNIAIKDDELFKRSFIDSGLFSSKTSFLRYLPEFGYSNTTSEFNIRYFAPYIDGPLKIAAMALLNSIDGVKFS
ncbi:MAG: hypothetical protein HRT98_02415 [Mycoplasmatales bacterium]|nr:hypothetical protein [Mycoplasmatales bacterium]